MFVFNSLVYATLLIINHTGIMFISDAKHLWRKGVGFAQEEPKFHRTKKSCLFSKLLYLTALYLAKSLLHIAQFWRINQKRNNFIKHCPPPCINKPPLSEMRIYIRHNLYKWGLDTRGGGGGEQCSTAKKWRESQLTTHEIRYNHRENTLIVNFLIKAWNFA